MMAKKSSKAKKTRRYIPRQTRKFQLRLDEPKDVHVAEVLDYARRQRREVTVIREAVALYWALENGNLEVLFEKFPQYRAHFKPDTSDLIEQFRQLLNQKGRAEQLEAAPTLSGPKLLDTPKLSLPLPDDEQDTVIIRRNTSTDTGMNFLTSALGLQQ
jgi:hypothetical protein